MLTRLKRNEKGFTLIEVLVALAITSVVVVAFLMALNTASKAHFLANVRTTAESLARTQIEDIKNQPYDVTGAYAIIGPFPANYAIDLIPSPVVLEAGLQKITVVVTHQGSEIITLEGYKVNR
jgi:prepilin-type N-terminal cleavage/methylation domain-containing protein